MPSTSPHALPWVEEILDRAITANQADPDPDLNRFRAIGHLSTAYLAYAEAARDGRQALAQQHLAEVERLAEPLR